MKDAYSFDTTDEGAMAAYKKMYDAYTRIFARCGLKAFPVEADTGVIGGNYSHEFMVPAETGENEVAFCEACGYAANRERAEIGQSSHVTAPDRSAPAHQKVSTPRVRTIEELSKFLKVDPSATAKLLVFMADEKPVAVLIRGDHEANEAKVRRAFGVATLVPAEADQILKATGAPIGFLGPVEIKIPLVVDRTVASMPAVVVGGNEADVHFTGVVPGRDFPLDRVLDVRNAEAGDTCPRCPGTLKVAQGIEIGHVFKLGTKYSKAMGATYLDDQGQAHHSIMGCYGIGVNRIQAAAVETGHDENGIVWPHAIAPYDVLIAPLQVTNAMVMADAALIEERLTEAGFDVLLDDRDLRPGVKFKDADLIGIPLRVVISERGIKEGTIEVNWRHDKDARSVPLQGAADAIGGMIREARAAHGARCKTRQSVRQSGQKTTD